MSVSPLATSPVPYRPRPGDVWDLRARDGIWVLENDGSDSIRSRVVTRVGSDFHLVRDGPALMVDANGQYVERPTGAARLGHHVEEVG